MQIEAVIKDEPSLSMHVAYEVPCMKSPRIPPHNGGTWPQNMHLDTELR
jgi:hypothetical protein